MIYTQIARMAKNMISSIIINLRFTPRNKSLIFNLKKARMFRAIKRPVTIRQFR